MKREGAARRQGVGAHGRQAGLLSEGGAEGSLKEQKTTRLEEEEVTEAGREVHGTGTVDSPNWILLFLLHNLTLKFQGSEKTHWGPAPLTLFQESKC